MSKIPKVSICVLVVMLLVSPTVGVPTTIFYQDGPQDPLQLPNLVHELGDKPRFPDDEWLESSWTETDYTPCTENIDEPNVPNVEVTIINKTNTSWTDLHYVGDVGASAIETFLRNNDGLINSGYAFKIDNIGVNTPLVYEDNPNLIFEPGETWKFVIQDYGSLWGGPPTPFGSVGVGNGSGGDQVSTGSIIAIPEPGALALLLLGGLALLRRRRSA